MLLLSFNHKHMTFLLLSLYDMQLDEFSVTAMHCSNSPVEGVKTSQDLELLRVYRCWLLIQTFFCAC